MGRLANAMFSIAGTIGIARKSNQDFSFPKFINYDAKERFGSEEDINIYEHLLNPLPEYQELNYNELPYEWGFRDIRLYSGNWNLNSHFQSDKYFSHCLGEVRQYFTFKDEPVQSDYTAIHYRAGDYDTNNNGYHPRCSFEYYERAVQHFSSDTKFLVFSDDKQAAIDLLEPLQINFSVADGGYIEEFKMMKKCKNFIIANSSFSLMASILADHPDKKIIAPKKWFGDVAGLETKDLYPEGSIII